MKNNNLIKFEHENVKQHNPLNKQTIQVIIVMNKTNNYFDNISSHFLKKKRLILNATVDNPGGKAEREGIKCLNYILNEHSYV